jgi:Xaa-Pro dipeptidase
MSQSFIGPELYPGHVQTMQARYESAAARFGFGALVIGSGVTELRFLDDQPHPYRPNPHFLHWVPLHEHPGSALVVRPGSKPVLIVHCPQDYWHQPAEPPPTEVAGQFDVRLVRSAAEVTALLGTDAHPVLIGPWAQWADLPAHVPRNPQALLDFLHWHRGVKTPWEIACLRAAAALAAAGHHAAVAAFRGGGSEYDILLAFLGGCCQTEEELPYGAIVARDEHGATLHYQKRDRDRGRGGRSLLIDAGCAVQGYASDITRTHARQGGTFADMIAALDQLQQNLCGAVRPGTPFADLHREAHLGIARLLQEWGLVRMAAPDMVAHGVTQAFLPHGLGHFLGLQVHDPGGHLANPDGAILKAPEDFPRLRLLRVLEPGHIVTIEPGIYFIDSLLEGLRAGPHRDQVDWAAIDSLRPFGGIRIEDDVLVTATGSENLTRPLL